MKSYQVMQSVVLAIFGFIISLFFQNNTNFLNPQIKNTSEVDSKSNISQKPDESIISISPTDENISGSKVQAKVVWVIDGDTIKVDLGSNNIKTVRYIGIDAPETRDPRKSVQCFGKEASNMNKSLVENQIVQLEKDVSETDKYGRLLRYVYAGDKFINKYLVAEGFAHSTTYPPDVKYQEVFRKSQEEARMGNKGLWSNCQ